MAIHVFLKTGFQCFEQFFTLFCVHVSCTWHPCLCLSALFHGSLPTLDPLVLDLVECLYKQNRLAQGEMDWNRRGV
jgi:hypothetical protein